MEVEYDYDEIGPNITEEELIKMLEEMDYVLPDNIMVEGDDTVLFWFSFPHFTWPEFHKMGEWVLLS